MTQVLAPLYFDYMSTTPLDPAVVDAMVACLKSEHLFGNAASDSHPYGFAALERVQEARQAVADLIHADAREVIWTSGATESNNLAIQGAAYFYQRQGKHLITMRTEHKSVLDVCAHLETCGFEVTYLSPQSNGMLDLQQLKEAMRPDTILVSIMHVNNETGVIQDIDKIGQLVKSRGALFHVDAAQSAGKIPLDVRNSFVDLLSLSAHKMYGPKGIGALYVRREPRVRLQAIIHGGGHERGLRSGTLPTHQIIGMGVACTLARSYLSEENTRLFQLRERLWKKLSILPGIHLNGEGAPHIPGCLNIYFDGLDSETLLSALNKIAISTGSACSSTDLSPSHVLLAMGLTRQQANQSIRISFGRFTTEQDIDAAARHIEEYISVAIKP